MAKQILKNKIKIKKGKKKGKNSANKLKYLLYCNYIDFIKHNVNALQIRLVNWDSADLNFLLLLSSFTLTSSEPVL